VLTAEGLLARKSFGWSWNELMEDAETTLSGSAFQILVAGTNWKKIHQNQRSTA